MQPQEQKSLIPAQSNEKTGNYWAFSARAYTLVFRAFLIALPLFVIVFMAICAQAFTKNSIYSFAMDLRSVASFVPSDYQNVSYTYQEGERVVCAYRDGVAVAGCGGVEIYSPDGQRLLDVPKAWSAPRAVASQKYLVAYEFGSKEFTVTDAYTVLFEGKTEFPILMASVADTGHFALVTTSDTHLSQVLLYDANFNLIECFTRSSATISVAFADNGKQIALSGIYTEGGASRSVVELYRIGAKEPAYSRVVQDLVMQLAFTDHRHLAVLSDKALRVLDEDGDPTGEISFEGQSARSFEVSEKGILLLLSAQDLHATHRVMLLDQRGELVKEQAWQGSIVSVAFAQEQVFFLSDGQIVKWDAEKESFTTMVCSPGATSLWIVGKDALRVAYAGEALYVEFE